MVGGEAYFRINITGFGLSKYYCVVGLEITTRLRSFVPKPKEKKNFELVTYHKGLMPKTVHVRFSYRGNVDKWWTVFLSVKDCSQQVHIKLRLMLV